LFFAALVVLALQPTQAGEHPILLSDSAAAMCSPASTFLVEAIHRLSTAWVVWPSDCHSGGLGSPVILPVHPAGNALH
jgi:hypothetical protein